MTYYADPPSPKITQEKKNNSSCLQLIQFLFQLANTKKLIDILQEK